MDEPTTPTGKRLMEEDSGYFSSFRKSILAIEDEARADVTDACIAAGLEPDAALWVLLQAMQERGAAQERARLRALYMATDAGQYCNIDVWHIHNHTRCNARCWCSWADPENCPYPTEPTDDSEQEQGTCEHDWVQNDQWSGGPSDYNVTQCVRCNAIQEPGT